MCCIWCYKQLLKRLGYKLEDVFIPKKLKILNYIYIPQDFYYVIL